MSGANQELRRSFPAMLDRSSARPLRCVRNNCGRVKSRTGSGPPELR
ncbi:hypothetical protein GLE_1310 [Lysobacter enzymogenes]|uniref:Uncharacterized protein n=1 Tax=Lysobacter enzymogenes TaxID=69 RepID=A0A0S2DDJ6_LYSEN|nr:hypothetical protein GLE_1310 [Lysobacter enzymogenes]